MTAVPITTAPSRAPQSPPATSSPSRYPDGWLRAGFRRESVRRIGKFSQFAILVRHELAMSRRHAPLRIALMAVPIAQALLKEDAMDFLVISAQRPDGLGIAFDGPGVTLLFCFANLQFLCWSAYDEHGFGTWDRLRGGPTTPTLVLGAKSVVSVAYLMSMFVFTLVVTIALGKHIEGSLAAWLLTAFVVALVATAYGIMLYVLLPSGSTYIVVSHAGALALAAFGGAVIPTEHLDGWIRDVAAFLPQGWAMQAFREASTNGGDLKSVVAPLCVLLNFGVAFATVAAWRFNPNGHKRPLGG